MNRLTIRQVGNASLYSIENMKGEIIGFISKERTGQFIHRCLQIPKALMEDIIKKDQYLIFSPGCMDEIRARLKELNSKNYKSK